MGIAGCVGSARLDQLARACSEIFRWQGRIRPAIVRTSEVDRASFGRNQHLSLPEDRFDQQPLVASGGSVLLVADARIDNRAEVETELGVLPEESSSISDGNLLLRALQRWGGECVDRVVGDYVAARWTVETRELLLVRSPLSTRPLFYHVGSAITSFAMAPQALVAAGVPLLLDEREAAAFVIGAQGPGERSFFKGICRVEQGQAVVLSGTGISRSTPWRPTRQVRSRYRADDLAAEMAEHLDKAVASRLRRTDGTIATHLSAGRDSNAVTATAARLLADRNEELLALTSAPPIGFRGPGANRALIDESALAATTARLHKNVRHLVCRHDGELDFARVREVNRAASGPVGHLSNYFWGDQIERTASAHGVTIMLTGQLGNFALSAGGTSHLVDLIQERGVGTWAREIVRAVRGKQRLASLLHGSIGPSLPPWAYALITRARGQHGNHSPPIHLLRERYREEARAAFDAWFGDQRPTRSQFDLRCEILQVQDPSTIPSLITNGIETRDPTADRRLIEFCFSLPLEVLISPDNGRPMFEAAMRDRVSPEVLASRLRGQQGADWQTYVVPHQVKRNFRIMARHSLVADLLDVGEIGRLLDGWPASFGSQSEMLFYRNDVLGAISMASFIVANFEEPGTSEIDFQGRAGTAEA